MTSTNGTLFRTTLVSLLCVELFSGVMQTYLTPLYSLLGRQYGVSAAALSWALLAPTLVLVVSTPALSRLGDIHGHRRLLRVSVGLVALGAVLVAVAPSYGVLLAGRALEGCIGAYMPLMFGWIAARHPGDPTRRAIGYLSGTLMFGALVGTVVTGPLVQAAGGPGWALWMPAVGALAGFALLWLPRGPEARPAGDQRMDWPGAVLLGLGLMGPALALAEGGHWGWSSGRTLFTFLGGVLVLAAWVVVELRVSNPLMDLRYLFRPRLVPVFLVGFFLYFAFLGLQVPNATYLALPPGRLGYGLGLAPLGISLAMLPPFLALTVLAWLTSRLGRSLGFPRVLALGAVLFVAGSAGLLFARHSLPAFITLTTVIGAGFGLVGGATRVVVVAELREGEVSAGSGIYELAEGLGAAFGTAMVAAILSSHTTAHTPAGSEQGYVLVWTALAVAGLLGAVTALAYAARLRRHRTEPAVTPRDLTTAQ